MQRDKADIQHLGYRVERNGTVISPRGNALKPYNVNGYQTVRAGGSNVYLHRVVAFAYLDNPENKCCVNHKDGDKTNNHVDNLEWVTAEENHRHAIVNNLNGSRKLTCEQVRDIIDDKRSDSVLGKLYNVHKTTINRIKRKATNKHCHASQTPTDTSEPTSGFPTVEQSLYRGHRNAQPKSTLQPVYSVTSHWANPRQYTTLLYPVSWRVH